MGFFSDLFSGIGEFFGIDEINFNQQVEDAIKKQEEELLKEQDSIASQRKAAQARLNSASAIERMEAEKELKELDARMSYIQRRTQRENKTAFEEKKAEISASREESPKKPTKPDSSYNKQTMKKYVKRAKTVPSIPSLTNERGSLLNLERDPQQRRPS